MEEEALAKLRREKRSTAPSLSSFQAKSSRSTTTTTTTKSPSPLPPQAEVQAQDLIVFPETRAVEEPDHFGGIDVDKLSKEELEKLLLDENFGAHSKVSRPSSLLGFNLSASYPGGHVCSSSPFQSGQWSSVLATPSSSSVSTPTQQPASMFSSGPFPKPGSFQNGFAPNISPYLTPQTTSFMTFAPIQPPASAAAMVFPPPPAVDPQMAKLLDKVASTYEYQKNGKGAGTEPDLAQAGPPSLAPNPPPPQLTGAEAVVSRFDWLDLDPLTKPRAESHEATTGSLGTAVAEPGELAGDPWDAVLETEGGSSPLPEKKGSTPTRALQKKSSPGGTPVTRSHSLNVPGSSAQRRARSQVLSQGRKGAEACEEVIINLPSSI